MRHYGIVVDLANHWRTARMSENDTSIEKTSILPRTSSFLGGVLSRTAWLSATAVSAAAVISFIQIAFGVRLVPSYAHLLSLYREFMHSIVTMVYSPLILLAERIASSWFHLSLRISIPSWWKDLATISTMNAAANLRGSIVAQRQSSLVTIVCIVAVFVYGLTLIGLLLFAVPLLWISLLIPPNDWEDRYQSAILWSAWRPYLLLLLAIAVAAALFFITSAYQL
jgi:hypothetical protein